MRKLIFLILIINCSQIYASVKIKNISLTAPDSNILYYGVDNEIEISSVNRLSMEIETKNLDVDFTSKNIIVRPKYNYGFATIIVKGGNRNAVKKIFRVELIPIPDYNIAGTMDTVIDKDKLISNPSINLWLPNCYLKAMPYAINGFEVSVLTKNELQPPFQQDSNIFSEEMLKFIRLLQAGDILYFDNVKVVSPDKNIRMIMSKKIIIK